jgi:PAS domain S-box-containing protein
MSDFNKRIVYGIELSLLILVGLLAISFYNFKRARMREKWIEHTNEVLVHTGRMQLFTAESEMLARDYMLTGKNIFIGKFLYKAQRTQNEFEIIKKLTVDNALIQPVLDSVGFYVRQRLNFSKQIILLRKTRGIYAAIKPITLGQGDDYKDKAGFYVQKVENNEDRLMVIRKADSVRAVIIMNASFLITISFIIALIIRMMIRSKNEGVERSRLIGELVKNDERNKKAEHLALFGTYDIDIANQTIDCSGEMCRMWGFDHDIKQKVIEDFINKVHTGDQELIRQKIRDSAHQKGNVNFQFRLVHNNELKYINAGLTVFRDADKKLSAITGYVQDITEITQKTIALTEANKELKVLFNRIGEVIFSRDVVNGQFTHISDTCESLFGYTAAEFMDDPSLPVKVVHPDDRHLVSLANAQLGQGKAINNQYRIIRKDGELRWLENKILPTLNDGGVLIRIDAVIKNITEKKLADLEREKIIADVIQRNQTLEQFTYIVSHNLRAPVANIVGLSQILELSPFDDPVEDQKIIKNISLSVAGLDAMVRDLGKILEVREQVNENKETVNIYDLLQGVQTSLSLLTANKRIQIRCDTGEINYLFTIRSYLHSICYNLLLNSINFRREDMMTVINVQTHRADNYIELLFTDNGKGIDMEKNGAMMFGLYRRFDLHIEGKGMGLFMVKTQVEAMGGTIEVRSMLNRGTEFSIKLPVPELALADAADTVAEVL